MQFSIIIPVYNSSTTFKECLDAIFNSSIKDFEVIVVSDNSTDNSVEIAKNYKCKIIELTENKGPSFARNTGAREAKGEILFFIDSDVIIKNNALKYVSEKFRESEVNAIQGIYSHDPDYKNILTQYQQSYTNYYIWPEKKKYASTLSTCCFAIRRKVFSLFKGFNTGIKRATCEDEEFGYNLIEKGFKTIILRELVVDHRVHYSFKYFIRRTFNRYTSHMKSYLRNKTIMKKVKQLNYIKVITGLPVIFFIILSGLILIMQPNKEIWIIFLILNLIFLSLHAGFIKFVTFSKGLSKGLGTILICYLDALMMLVGLFYGCVSFYLLNEEY